MKHYKAGTWVKNSETKQYAIVGRVKKLRYTKARVHFLYQFNDQGQCVGTIDALHSVSLLRACPPPPFADNWHLIENVVGWLPTGIEMGATCALVSMVDEDDTVFIAAMKVGAKFAAQINNALLTAAA